MKKGIFFALFVGCALTTIAQTTFDKLIRDQNFFGVSANGTFLKANGQIIVSGNFQSNNSHVSKFDSLGVPIWTKTFNFNDYNESHAPLFQRDNIIQLQDSNYLLTRNVMDWSNNKALTYLIKFDDDGLLIWSKRIHKNNISNSSNSFTLEMNTGKFLVVSMQSGTGEIAVSRISSSGNIEVVSTLFSSSNLEPISFVKNGNEAFIVVKNQSPLEILVVRIDETGNLIDSKKLNNFSPVDACYANGKLFVIGNDINFGKAILKIDYTTDSVQMDFGLSDLVQKVKLLNNKLALLGSTMNFGDMHTFDLTTEIWESFIIRSGVVDVHEVDSTHFYTVGNGPTIGVMESFGEPQFGLNLFDVSVQNWSCHEGPYPFSPFGSSIDSLAPANFTIISSAPFISDTLTLSWTAATLTHESGCVDHLGSLDEQNLADKIVLSPNPANLYVNIDAENLRIRSIELTSLNGSSIPSVYSLNRLQVDTLPNGIYFIRLTVDNNVVVTKKLVVQH